MSTGAQGAQIWFRKPFAGWNCATTNCRALVDSKCFMFADFTSNFKFFHKFCLIHFLSVATNTNVEGKSTTASPEQDIKQPRWFGTSPGICLMHPKWLMNETSETQTPSCWLAPTRFSPKYGLPVLFFPWILTTAKKWRLSCLLADNTNFNANCECKFLHDAKNKWTLLHTGGPCSTTTYESFAFLRILNSPAGFNPLFHSKVLHSWSTKPSETHFTHGICHRRASAFLYHKTRSRLSRNHLPRSPESLQKIFAAVPAFVLNNKFDATIYNTILILALWMVLGKNHAICNLKTTNVESGNLENFQSQDCWARSAKDKLGGQVSAWHFWSWHPSIHNFMVGGDS